MTCQCVRPRSPLEWVLITLILLAASVLRFHDLGNIPKGLEHDEVATWHMVSQVLDGQRPLYFEEGYGHEPLFNYLAAIPVSIWGSNWLGERFWAPWFGMLAVAATYALMRRMFGPLVGLSAAGLQATVLWALFFNRLGLRLNLLPTLLCVAAYCFWRGLECSGLDFLSAEPASAGTAGDGTHLHGQAQRWAWFPASGAAGGSTHPHGWAVRWAWFPASGALVGLCLYTYMSSRAVPLIWGVFCAYLLGRDLWAGRTRRSGGPGWRALVRRARCGVGLGWRALVRRWLPIVACLIVAGLVAMPLALYLLARPSTTATPQREGQIDRPWRELRQGNVRPLLQNAWALVKMWNVDGERYWQLNVAHRPVFVEPISGALFWLGVVALCWQWKQPRMAFLIAWIGLGMVPSLLTSEAPSWPRTMLASPAGLALPGIAVQALLERWPWSASRAAARAVCIAGLALSIMLTGALTYRDFLVVWPQHPRVRYAFQSSLTEALRYLDASEDSSPVVAAGLSPHDMDRWTEQVTLRRRDLSVRWIDTRSALVLPPGNRARLVVLDITPFDPSLSAWAGIGQAEVLGQGQVVPRSGTERDADAPVLYDPAYTVYRLDLAGLRRQIEGAGRPVYVGSDPQSPAILAEPPTCGGLVQLLGYEWLAPLRVGADARLLTFWMALGAGPGSTLYGEPALRTFVHLLDGTGLVAGVDVLGAAPDTWQAGDVIVQVHAFAAPASPGSYAVEVGWYVPPDGPRLPVGPVAAPGDRLLLERVEVGR